MDIWLFFIFLVATFAAGATGAMFPTGTWYKSLNKPNWVPPNSMAFWALQIAFNTLWTPVFFGKRDLKGSLPVMAGLWLAVLGCLITHWQMDLWAGLAFLPYMAWVTVAAALNISMWRLNRDQRPLPLSEIEPS